MNHEATQGISRLGISESESQGEDDESITAPFGVASHQHGVQAGRAAVSCFWIDGSTFGRRAVSSMVDADTMICISIWISVLGGCPIQAGFIY